MSQAFPGGTSFPADRPAALCARPAQRVRGSVGRGGSDAAPDRPRGRVAATPRARRGASDGGRVARRRGGDQARPRSIAARAHWCPRTIRAGSRRRPCAATPRPRTRIVRGRAATPRTRIVRERAAWPRVVRESVCQPPRRPRAGARPGSAGAFDDDDITCLATPLYLSVLPTAAAIIGNTYFYADGTMQTGPSTGRRIWSVLNVSDATPVVSEVKRVRISQNFQMFKAVSSSNGVFDFTGIQERGEDNLVVDGEAGGIYLIGMGTRPWCAGGCDLTGNVCGTPYIAARTRLRRIVATTPRPRRGQSAATTPRPRRRTFGRDGARRRFPALFVGFVDPKLKVLLKSAPPRGRPVVARESSRPRVPDRGGR